MIQAPCKDCENRTITCHSTCEKYLQFKRDKELERRSMKKDIDDRSEFISRISRLKRK